MANPLPKIVRDTLGDPADIHVIFAAINRRDRTLKAAPEYVRAAMTKVLRSGGRLLDLQWEIDQFYGSTPQPARVFLQDRVFRRTAQVWSETEALVDHAADQLDRFAATVAHSASQLRMARDVYELQRGADVLSLFHDELMMVRGLLHRVTR